MKTEPKSVIYFLWNYYEPLVELFEAQGREGFIKSEMIRAVCEKHGHDIEQKLVDYKVLKKINNDYEFRSIFYSLLEFNLNEFKRLLSETIEKYHYYIGELFRKIRKGLHDEKFIIIQRVSDLISETRDFTESVENNSIKLLAKTRELKANLEKIDYREKIHKASEWIEYYILPMNKILDVHQNNSIASKLFEIANFANEKRLLVSDEQIRVQFEKLYFFLLSTNDELLRQSKILTNELLPLIERIRTESIILSGFIELLKDPFDVTPPPLLKASRDLVYNKHMMLNTKEFWEQFEVAEKVYINPPPVVSNPWIFDKDAYRTKLNAKLPVDNFFKWAYDTLEEEDQFVPTERFFSLTTLLFEDDLTLEFPDKNSPIKVRTEEMTYRVPKIKVDKYGIF